jgi:aminopeptidase N
MKIKSILLLVLMFALFNLTAQHTATCSHKMSFAKSWISDTLDAISYTIYLNEFDFANHEITAQTEIELISKIDDLTEIKLELQDLTVDEIYVDGIEITDFSHDGMILSIPVTDPLNMGDSVSVSVAYHGEPFHETWGGFHWSGEYCFNLGVGIWTIPHNLGKTWFPCIDDFQDRAYYTIYATVDAGKDAVCGGLLEEIADNGNGTFTYKWVMQQTIPTYLASVAVGDYARWTDTYNGINGDIPIEIWVRPADSNKVDGSFQNLNEILSIYEDKFGPYRFDRVGYVGTAIGAMEHATNIAYPHFVINGGLGYESLLAHELAHMWFGDNVTCATAEDMWINEGWATFFDAIYQEFLYSREQYMDFIRNKHKEVIQFCHTPSTSPIGDGYFFPLNQIPQNVTYGMSAYDRGCITAHTLRGYLGDEVFFDAMTAFNEEFKYNYASSEDMRDFLTNHTGTDMAGWFDNWIFNSGTPHYSIDSFSVVPLGSNADVTVYMRQKRHGPEFIGNGNKVELTFMDDSWNQHTENIFFDGQYGNSTFNIPLVPEAVYVDLNELMSDATTDYSRTIKSTGLINLSAYFFKLEVQNITDSVFFRIEHNWAPPDSLQNPIQGLTISPYRYWKIDGIFNEDFVAIGGFRYNKSSYSYLDDSLIMNQNDSVVMLYRLGTAYDWQFVNFNKVGTWSSGNLYIENLQKGEYALAVCDDTFVGIKGNSTDKNTGLNIFPNPSNGVFNIEINQPGTLTFYDIEGKIIDIYKLNTHQNHLTWTPDQLIEGTYFVRFTSAANQIISTEKLIYIKD